LHIPFRYSPTVTILGMLIVFSRNPQLKRGIVTNQIELVLV